MRIVSFFLLLGAASVLRAGSESSRLGLPALAGLDSEGRPLVTRETGAVGQAGGFAAHDPANVAALLAKWRPAPQP